MALPALEAAGRFTRFRLDHRAVGQAAFHVGIGDLRGWSLPTRDLMIRDMKSVGDEHASTNVPHLFGTQDDFARMFQMMWSFQISQIVRSAVLFSLPEHLARGPSTAAEIAKAESLHVEATFRLLRACASIGLLTYEGQGQFAATPLLNTLRKDAPNSLAGMAFLATSEVHYATWGHLADAVKTGEPQTVATLGRTSWEHMAGSPEEAAAFAGAMKSVSAVFNQHAAKLIDTHAHRVAVDVGGANGTLVHALMNENSALRGIVFDLPHIVSTATGAALEWGFQDRFSAIAGDFFTAALPPGDLFLLKLILHDWDDEDCLSILRNCRRAIDPNGRLVVMDMLIGEIGAPGPAPLMDLNMLVVLGGKERTLHEFEALFAASGFRFSKATPTSTPLVLIEAVPV